ncbi:hypothetical protein PVAND_014229 [Polypedilum vanderplanki]|uniref:EF-hand domain-containing protein n=1 Tax=Polypedilum vanderplanki TaxID=319348 RepID=A0A9J6CRQ1_POLVA|nr:hypothetical protein PVAND_014229 [Polypedilum vanderplanki]
MKEILYCELEELEQPQRYRPDSLAQICKTTKFSEPEIKRMYRGFKNHCPNGMVKEDTFKIIYAQFFPQGANTGLYAHYIFNTLDKDHTGTLSFEKFVQGLSVLSRGTLEEKLCWTFQLYDINSDGRITKEEMSDIVTAVYNLMGHPIEEKVDEEKIKEKVESIFNKMDRNHDDGNDSQRQQQQSIVERNQITNHSNSLHFNFHPNNGSNNGCSITKYNNNSSNSKHRSRNFTSSQHRTIHHYHTHHHQKTTVFGNKMRNNFGHKVSQTKRIQLSTAAKRCKSLERSSATDNNNQTEIIEDESEELVESACNESSNQSTDSPTLVKVKTWYTESSIVLPSHLA